jgi:hypothetical protein
VRQIIRKLSSGQLVLLEHITGAGGSPNRFAARLYSPHRHVVLKLKDEEIEFNCLARCFIEGNFYYDIGHNDSTGKKEDKTHSHVYRLIDTLFPELINKGLKSEGYVIYSISEIEKSGIII